MIVKILTSKEEVESLENHY